MDFIDNNFVHLHLHTVYSLLDGYNKPELAAKRAKDLNMKALAITDHNHLGGVIEFQDACKKEGIKSILGCEMYWTWDTNILSLSKEDRDAFALSEAKKHGVVIKDKAKKTEIKELIEPYEYDTKQYHIILLAINQVGWSNLVKLQSEAADKCTFNGRFCCDNDMLRKYSEGLIMTTACVANAIPHLLINNRLDEANILINEWKDIFGDRLYLEIQPIGLEQQRIVNWYYLEWSKEKHIQCIATTDAHYTTQNDWDDHDTLLCIGIGKKKSDQERMRYANDLWIRSYDEMVEGFERQSKIMLNDYGEGLFDEEEYEQFYLQALDNTNTIADIIEDIKLGSDTPLLPKVTVPNNLTPEKYLTTQAYNGLYKYKKQHQEIDLKLYERRLYNELNIINSKGYADYMLIVKEYIDFCEDNDIPVGPGRGSAAGSLSLFVNGITKCIDPIKYKLLFERFLTKDRTALPDIDCDFSYVRRDEVIHHLEDEYGKNCVAHIGTYSELGVKSGIKDIGRVLDMDFETVNSITKRIDEITDEDPKTCFKMLDDFKDSEDEADKLKWQEFNVLEEQNPELFRLARLFEGVPRNFGVHASGVLITPMPINDLFPTRVDKSGTTIAIFTGTQLEELGACKFDILGLKTLDVLDRTCKSIDKNMTVKDLYAIVGDNLDDDSIYDLIRDKQNDGMFQIESNLFKSLIDDIQPQNLNDIIFLNSVARPGPLSANMHKVYAANKTKGGNNEPLRGTHEILKDSFDTIVYQEDVMLIAKMVAKVDDNQADSYYRKAIAKKKKDKMALCRRWFIYGKINQEPPEGYNNDNENSTMYDPTGKYGSEILGGINSGYTEEELIKFWESLKDYCSYLFNKSHAACYSFLTYCTAYLKKMYPPKFMAALLSMQVKQEKIDKYIKVSRAMDIAVKVPNINLSDKIFTEVNGDIFYGLSSIKGVGENSVDAIISARPFTSLEDTMNKVEKKLLNKRVGIALIKTGAFEEFNANRNALINTFYTLRKDKDEKLNEDAYDENTCIDYERELLGTPITYLPYWDTVQSGDIIETNMRLISVREKIDKRNNMMAFIKSNINGSEVNCVCFARQYTKNANKFDMKYNEVVSIKGHVDDKKTLIIDKVLDEIKEKKRIKLPLFLAKEEEKEDQNIDLIIDDLV